MKDLKKVTNTRVKGNLRNEKKQPRNKNGNGPKNKPSVVNEEEQEIIIDESTVKNDIVEAGKKEERSGTEKKKKEESNVEKIPEVDAEKDQVTNAEADIVNKKS